MGTGAAVLFAAAATHAHAQLANNNINRKGDSETRQEEQRRPRETQRVTVTKLRHDDLVCILWLQIVQDPCVRELHVDYKSISLHLFTKAVKAGTEQSSRALVSVSEYKMALRAASRLLGLLPVQAQHNTGRLVIML